MSSPASAAFLKAWRHAAKQPVLLAKVELTTPTTQTLYLASGEVITPDGVLWEAAIQAASPIRAPGDFLSSGPDLCSTDITLQRKKLGFQAAGKDTTDLLVDFQLYNANVTVYLWERTLINISDALQVFKGTINRPKLTPSGVQLFLSQPR